ncbi:hypothetical protein DsansV1_C09g0096231 [Dioscorea sansibarensis]
MGRQESLEFYLNLSRKELQGLCKRSNLPANRSHVQLAKSLVSHFKRKNGSSKLSKDQSSNNKGKNSIPIKNTKGVIVSQTAYPDSNDWRHSSVGIQIDRIGALETQNSQKVYDSNPHFVHPCPSRNERAENYSSSACLLPSVATNVQDITGIIQPAIECRDWNRNEPQKSILVDCANDKTGNSGPVSCKRKKVSDFSKDSGFVASAVPTRAAPSFEFFTTSDEGISLHVDLNSSLSDWVGRLKNDVCIYEESQHCKSMTLGDHIRGLLDAEDPMKDSSGKVGKGCQSGGTEKNNGCTNSSSSSVVSENCHTEAYQTDVTIITSGCLAANQMVGASCTAHSDILNNVSVNIPSCARDKDLMLQESMEVACSMPKNNKSVIDASVKAAEMTNILNPEGRKISSAMEHKKVNIISVGSDNAKVSRLDKESVAVCEKQSPPKCSALQDNLDVSSIGNLKHSGGASQVSADGVRAGRLSEALDSNKSSSESDSCQINQPLLDHPMTDAQSDVGSSDNMLNGRLRCSLGPSATEVPVSAVDDELDRSIEGREKESSECSQFPGFLVENGKKPHSPKTTEEFQCKKQHSNGESKSGAVMNLRSTEAICDSVLPRRSSRLVSKV